MMSYISIVTSLCFCIITSIETDNRFRCVYEITLSPDRFGFELWKQSHNL